MKDIEFLEKHCHILNRSFEEYFEKPLCEFVDCHPIYIDLDNSNSVIVSHGLGSDPIFNYANKNALDLFEMSWSDFTSLPSRYSAETPEQEERESFLKEVSNKGYSSSYSGVRISKSGKRFAINDAKVWNLFDSDGKAYGQAATFDNWEYL